MIALAICWLALFRASIAAGDLILRFLGASPEEDDYWFISFWVGLLTIAAVVLAVVPFAPAYYAAPLLLLGLYTRTPATPGVFWPVAAAATYVSSGPVRLYDTALYHQPAIDWMSTHGLVPGLALVHFRFGFTSSWLAITSLFNVGPLHLRAGVVVTGLAIAVALTQWISLYRRNNSPETRFYLAGLPLLLLFLFFDSAIVSPSPNLGAGLAVFTGIWMLLRSPSHAAGAVMAAGAMAVKLSAAPLLLAALSGAPRRLRTLALAGALTVPFLLANFWTTRCPLFPAAFACVESPRGLPSAQVRRIAYETLNWARYAGPYPRAVEYSSFAWVPHYLSSRRNAVVAFFVVVSLTGLLMRRQLNLAVLAAVLGSLYVYAAAPDPRFGIGFLVALPALVLPALPLPRLSRTTLTLMLAALLTIGAMAGEWVSNRNSPDDRYKPTIVRLLLPSPAWTPSQAHVPFEHNGVRFYRPPEADRCGAAPLPCTPYSLPPSLKRCGRGWCR